MTTDHGLTAQVMILFYISILQQIIFQVWRVKYTLAKIRKAARELLTLEDKDPRRLFEGNAILRRLVRIGVLDENRMKLDYVLGKYSRLTLRDKVIQIFVYQI